MQRKLRRRDLAEKSAMRNRRRDRNGSKAGGNASTTYDVVARTEAFVR
jgi:hypothetical protein